MADKEEKEKKKKKYRKKRKGSNFKYNELRVAYIAIHKSIYFGALNKHGFVWKYFVC